MINHHLFLKENIMLTTYQAKIINNQIYWIDTPPPNDELLVHITVLADNSKPKRTPPPSLKAKMTFNDDSFDTHEMWQDTEYVK